MGAESIAQAGYFPAMLSSVGQVRLSIGIS
jgi:hypothetical protein